MKFVPHLLWDILILKILMWNSNLTWHLVFYLITERPIQIKISGEILSVENKGEKKRKGGRDFLLLFFPLNIFLRKHVIVSTFPSLWNVYTFFWRCERSPFSWLLSLLMSQGCLSQKSGSHLFEMQTSREIRFLWEGRSLIPVNMLLLVAKLLSIMKLWKGCFSSGER